MTGIGVLGASRIAPKAVMGPAAKRGDCAVVRVGAREAGRAAAYAKEHGAGQGGTYEDVLADDAVTLVYNGLPASHHAAWTIGALDAGKHVLCEKPFAMNTAEADAMLAAARANDRRVIEAFHHRYHPTYALFLRWLTEDRIGEVRRIEAAFDVTITGPNDIRHAPETGGGAMMDLGCYPLAWAIDAGGGAPEIEAARAELTERGVDRAMRATLRFGGGAKAFIACDMGPEAKRENWLTVEGARGRIDFRNPLAPQNGSMLTMTTGGETVAASEDRSATYDHQLAAVLEALETGEPLPTEGEATLRQQRALDAVHAAAGLGHLRQPAAALTPSA